MDGYTAAWQKWQTLPLACVQNRRGAGDLKAADTTSINMQPTFLSFLCCLKQLLNDFSSKFHTILQTTHSAHLTLFIHSLLTEVVEINNSICTAKQIYKMKF